MQIDLTQIWKWIQKYSFWVLILVLCLVVFQCNRSGESATALAKANKDIEVLKTMQNNYLSMVKKREELERQKSDSIDLLTAKLDSVKTKISEISKSGKQKIEKVQHSTKKEIVDFFKERYSPKDSISQIAEKLCFTDTITYQVATDIVKGEVAEAELSLTKQALSKSEQITKTQNDKINLLEKDKLDLKTVVDLKEAESQAKNTVIKEQEKSIRSEKNKTTFYKITTIAAILGGGYLLIK